MSGPFTLGPWSYEQYGGDWNILYVQNDGPLVLGIVFDHDRYSQEADARLISAAPDLYEALANVAEWIGQDCASLSAEDEDKIHAALAKVRGED